MYPKARAKPKRRVLHQHDRFWHGDKTVEPFHAFQDHHRLSQEGFKERGVDEPELLPRLRRMLIFELNE